MKKVTKIYLGIAFIWTWSGWILAGLISHMNGFDLNLESTIFNFWSETWGSNKFLPQLLFAFAVYGPFMGFILTTGFKKLWHLRKKGNLSYGWYVLIVPIISVFPAFLMSWTTKVNLTYVSFSSTMLTILLYFLSNLITSGTEEFGWRGVLYPALKAQGLSFWDVAWKGGFIWAIWHYPLLILMYLPLGVVVLVPSLIGFTASIVAMNYITNFIYEKTQKIFAVVLLHALNNTMSFALILLFPKTPYTVFSSLMAWVIVWWLEKYQLKNLDFSLLED
ncbi:MAG: CPBP family intramembrane metalloprotease [Clostridia bacterium]|nr:CPBP family intramembrane metalloprotease [Clostridia bacterium]